MTTLKDKYHKHYEIGTKKPLYKYYKEKDVKDAVLELHLAIDEELSSNSTDALIIRIEKRIDEIFGDWENEL